VATQTPMLLDVGHFKAPWDRLLTPETHSGAQNNSSGSVQNSNAAQGLLDRLELMQNFQPGSGSTDNTERVRNFLAISIQFGSTATQWANASVPENLLETFRDLFPLPEEIAKSATVGKLTQRFVVMPWAAWTFIAAGLFVTATSGCVLFGILLQSRPVTKQAGIPEFDVIPDATAQHHGVSQRRTLNSRSNHGNEMTLSELLLGLSPKERGSLRRMVEALSGKAIVLRPSTTEGNSGMQRIVRDTDILREAIYRLSFSQKGGSEQKASTFNTTSGNRALSDRLDGNPECEPKPPTIVAKNQQT